MSLNTRTRGRLSALAAVALVVAGAVSAAPAVADATPATFDSASLEWGLNLVHQGGSPAGGCNYFTAGYGDGSEATYRTVDRDLRIIKRTAEGEALAAGKDTRCNQDGPGGTIGQQLYFADGEGERQADGSVQIAWEGALTVYAYGGLVPWYLADPVLNLDANGDGEITAKVGGFASSMADPDVKVPLDPQEGVVVATIHGAATEGDGFTIEPAYQGVDYFPLAGEGRSTTSAIPQETKNTNPGWGSWPESFVDFQYTTGLSSYWHTSGLSADPQKPPLPLTVDFEAEELELAPVVVAHPGSKTVSEGTDVTLQAVGTGAPAPTTQWQRLDDGEWNDLAGQNADVLVLPEVSIAEHDGAQYRAVFATGTVQVPTAAATLTVVAKEAVLITQQPTSLEVQASRVAQFQVVATGSTLSYTWQRKPAGEGAVWEDWGGTASTLRIAAVGPELNGSTLRVIVSNGVDEPVVSEEVGLTVTTEALAIVGDVNDLTVEAGGAGYFRASITGAPYGTWTWEKSADEGESWSAVQTITQTSGSLQLYVYSITPDQDGELYRARGTNGVGEDVVSRTAVLTVTTQPLAWLDTSTSLRDVELLAGTQLYFSRWAQGAPQADWTWETSEDDGETWNVAFTQTGSNNAFYSVTTDTPVSLHGLLVKVTGTNGIGDPVTDGPVRVSVRTQAPTFTRLPEPLSVVEGTTASFTATVTAGPRASWTWQTSRDGESWGTVATSTTPGNTSTHSLGAVTVDDDGLLVRAIADNGLDEGSPIVSPAAKLTVAPATGERQVLVDPGTEVPTGVATAINVGLGGFDTALTSGLLRVSIVESGAWTPGTNPATAQRPSTGTVGFSVLKTSGGLGTVRLAVAGSGLDPAKTYEVVTYNSTTLADRSYDSVTPISLREAFPVVTTQPQAAEVYSGQLASFTAAAEGTLAVTLQWQSSLDDGESWSDVSHATAASLTVQALPASDGALYRLAATNSTGTAYSEPAALSVLPLPATVEPSVTLSATELVSTDEVELTVTGSGFHPDYAYGYGRPPLAGQRAGVYVSFGRFAEDWRPSQGAGGAARSAAANAWALPAESINLVGGTAAGAIELSPEGSFEVAFTVSKATADEVSAALGSGRYGVYTYPGGGAVQDRFETYTSVTFLPAAEITSQPKPVRANTGDVAFFELAFTSPSSAQVQWQRSDDGGLSWRDVPGATSTSLELAAVRTTDNGAQLRAVVVNAGGTVHSDAAGLVVQVPGLSFAAQPKDTSVAAGGVATFSSRASGDFVTYRWQSSSDGVVWVDVEDADHRNLTVPTSAVSQSGTQYRVVASNPAGSVESAAATLTVTKAAPSVKVSVKKSFRFASKTKATVTVGVPAGVKAAAGKVTVKVGSTVVGKGTVKNGKAQVTLTKKLLPGSRKLVAEFAGGADLAAAKSVVATVKVSKAKSAATAKLAKSSVKAGKRATLRLTVKGTGVKATGKVRVVVTQGKKTVRTITVKVNAKGKATVKLPKLAKGKYAVKAQYLGSKTVAKKAAKQVTLRVR